MTTPPDSHQDAAARMPQARRLLAEIEAEIRHQTGRQTRMREEGADHFAQLHQDALPHLTPENVGNWSDQAAAVANVRNV